MKPAGLIFLHGLGDTPAGWSSLQSALPRLQSSLQHLQMVFPAAPTIPISINGGMTMPGWFDLYDWPIGVGVQEDVEGTERAVQTVQDSIRALQDQGIDRNRIVVGGFSQGGAIALLTAYREENLAGCVCLSGWWPRSTPPTHLQTPLFWGHGRFDDKVLFEQQAHGVNLLQGVSQAVVKDYPMGHESHPDELQDLANFLDSLLFAEEDDSSKEL